MDRYKFGEFIYQKRKSLHLTQEELGRKVGVTNKAVSKWEVGETLPDVMMLEPLAAVLQVTIDELLTHTDKAQEEKKSVKINKTMFIILIGLVLLEIATIITFLIIMNYEEKPVVEKIDFKKDNFQEIVDMNPLINLECEGQSITITSTFGIDEDFMLEKEDEQLTFTVVYSFNYYYYRSDNTLGVVTYYNRNVEVVLTNQEAVKNYQIILEPQIEIIDFVGFKNIEIDYSVYDCTGLVINK